MPDNLTTKDNRSLTPDLMIELKNKARSRRAIRHRTHDGIYLSLHYHHAAWVAVAFTLHGQPHHLDLAMIQEALHGQAASWILSGPVAVLHCRA